MNTNPTNTTVKYYEYQIDISFQMTEEHQTFNWLTLHNKCHNDNKI